MKVTVSQRAIAIFLALQSLSGSIPEAIAGAPVSANEFADCAPDAGCPVLVRVPASAGRVRLGSPLSEPGRLDNEAQYETTVAEFALGKYEVTVAEYRACMAEGACAPPEWLDPAGDQHIETGSGRYYRNFADAVTGARQPIVGVSLRDAEAFAAWLSKKTGKRYRLPSESEWEYAARAGTRTAYWWGDAPDKVDGSAWANCQGCGGLSNRQSKPVGSYPANPWGLHDMSGNVWEWVADTYCEDNAAKPADGSARSADDCAVKDAAGLRTLRGGSSFYGADKVRSAARLRNFDQFRNISVGFRVARSL